MEEKKKKENILQRLKKFCLKNSVAIFSAGVAVGTTTVAVLVGCKNQDLKKKNEELEKENQTLRGEVRECERENKRLSRENGNLNYQLGKKSSTKG